MFPLRDENPTHHTPVFVIALIVINAAAFFYEFSLGDAAESFIRQYAIVPVLLTQNDSILSAPLITLITSMFLHGGLGHLVGNLWYLWLFGDNIEDSMGHFRFVVFYFVCGIAAGLVHIWMDPTSTTPTIGASGAISGVLGGYTVLFPRIRIRTLIVLGFYINVARIPAVFYLGIWFAMQALGILGPQTGVAFGAHIGGFIAGVLYTLLLTRPQRAPITQRYESRRLPRL